MVLGGNGFTGAYVARELVARGANTVKIMSRSVPVEARRVDGAQYLHGSITSEEDLINAMDDIDIVFQLAAYIGSPPFGYLDENDRKLAYDINYQGMMNVISVSKRNNVKLLVYTSSIDVVYKHDGFDNAREEDLEYQNMVKDRNPCHYQASKLEVGCCFNLMALNLYNVRQRQKNLCLLLMMFTE